MTAKYISTSLGLCVPCLDGVSVDGTCECSVMMRVCQCGNGPLNETDDECGECR